MKKALEQSIFAGGVVTIGYFLLTVGSIVMVMGDGTAPWITRLMLKLGQVPIALFGLSGSALLVVAPPFWGAAAGVVAFLVLSLANASESRPRAGAMAVLGTLLLLVFATVFLL